jgi:DNA-binding beta-propeller fold protein YncE
MALIAIFVRCAPVVCAGLTLLDGCSGGAMPPPFLPSTQTAAPERTDATRGARYIYVSNRTKNGTSELLVYRAGARHPRPIERLTQGLVDAAGVAVDSSGNVYVANGAGGNVLEFAPRGAAVAFTYSEGLVHPIDVAVRDGTLYVADQGNAGNGYFQQVFEYPVGHGTPSIAIGGIGDPPQLNESIAVSPAASSQGTFFVTASTAASIPPAPVCSKGNSYLLAQNVLPTLWTVVPLSHTLLPSGLAFDSAGNLYIADICANDVAIYSRVDYIWTYAGTVPGRFNEPLFVTIRKDLLAIPSYSGEAAHKPGNVTLIDLSGKTPTVTITEGLQHPIGAATF